MGTTSDLWTAGVAIGLLVVLLGSGVVTVSIPASADGEVSSFSSIASVPDAAPIGTRPTMGWNSWNHFACDIDETLIKEIADAMVDSGLKAAGYDVLTLDACWSARERDESGNLVHHPETFPSGMKALGDYLHAKGLRYGIYASIGTRMCQDVGPGSLDREFQDVSTFASWGVDYIKADRCSADGLDLKEIYARWRDAIAASGHPMILSASDNNPPDEPWAWGPMTAHQWRMSGDISDDWTDPPGQPDWMQGMLDIFDRNGLHAAATAPGAYNDPDMLQVGNGGMTDVEYRTHFGLWALMSAPLIAGNDVRTMRPAIRDILTHPEVIEIDQDPLAFQAIRAGGSADVQVWHKPLSQPGARAVGLLNRGDSPILIAVDWTDLGLAPGDATVRDVWARTDRGTFRDGYSVGVEPHGLALLRVVGTERPVSEGFLSDQPWTYMANEIGLVERDESNGGSGAGDGHSLRMNDVTYAKGLGAHAPSAIEFRSNGVCSTFTAAVGVDDEVGDSGSVLFQVWGDGERLFETEVLTGAMPAQEIAVDLSGRRSVRLQVVSVDTTTGDHADWADARVTCDPSAPPNRAPVLTSFSPDSHVVMGLSESRTFTVVAMDPDGDPLAYSWRINGTSVAGSGSAFTFVGAEVGTYLVAVVASDGLAAVGHTWTVDVQADPAPEEPPPAPGRRGVSVVGVAVFASLAVTGAILAWILRPRTR